MEKVLSVFGDPARSGGATKNVSIGKFGLFQSRKSLAGLNNQKTHVLTPIA
jgi:hypothetical protein